MVQKYAIYKRLQYVLLHRPGPFPVVLNSDINDNSEIILYVSDKVILVWAVCLCLTLITLTMYVLGHDAL